MIHGNIFFGLKLSGNYISVQLSSLIWEAMYLLAVPEKAIVGAPSIAWS